ncbi:MAG TPA: glycosyltransferase family 2 protein [Candidatus Chromulinivoraceae bacterium]|nr:glycosyltransferase family 2 protein [Candidatus Chromulinivoraceae bacterium]
MKDTKIKATIFIPTWQAEPYLNDLLRSVFRQKVDFEYEVLIFDTSSTDKTPQIIEKYKKKHKNLRTKTITKAEFGHGKTRNEAAHEAKGEFVVYLSHDAIPSHDSWLHEMIAPFAINPKIVGVTGKQIPRPKCVPLQKYEIRTAFRNLGPDFGTTIFYKDNFMKNPIYKDSVTFYSDVNSAARRSYLVDELPYRDVPYSEDQLFGRDVIEAGLYKVYAARASVLHSNDLTLREYKHRMFDEIIGLRKIGTKVTKPSIKHIIKVTILGVIKDAVRTIYDGEYSLKRKIYWLLVNPLYHIEKWRGVRLAVKVELSDDAMFGKHSLEEMRAKISK